MKNKICVVDVGYGNINSIVSIYAKFGITVALGKLPEDLDRAERILLPGVGHFDSATEKLNQMNMKDKLIDIVSNGNVPLLGVCLGMQLLGTASDEGTGKGLNLIPGESRSIYLKARNNGNALKTNMGWRNLISRNDIELKRFGLRESRYYFAHSFAFVPHFENAVLAWTDVDKTIPAVVHKNNVIGVQFHPEKSGINGINFLINFATSENLGI